MKKVLVTLAFAAMTAVVMAVPAKRGQWRTLKLADGTEVRAQLVGDEHGHFWKTAEGQTYQLQAGTSFYQTVDAKTITDKASARRRLVNTKRTKRLASRRVGEVGSYTGKKKGLIILVNYKDESFQSSNNNALYQRIANEEGFSEGKFKGSMCDYFKAQSRGQFELDFDVVGPVTVSKNAAYYGSNDSDGNDLYPATMVGEAVNLAKSYVTDWTQYNWDGDNEVDQVYVVYAGHGEADGGEETTIWPHAWSLSDGPAYGDGNGRVKVADNLYVNNYACGSELNYNNEIEGIGTMCHEFSHCLGYPDFYDTDYSGGQGMCIWDLMDSGSYNGDGYQPAGYTSYERWLAGWLTPIELGSTDLTVENMKSLQSGGESYVMYNPGNSNEFFLLENRQLDGWDASLMGRGLLIIHVDYSESVWASNQPNDDPSHQRCTWIPADKKYDYETYYGSKYYDVDGIEKDPFPYGSNNYFNKQFGTMAKLFNKNTDGTYYLSNSVEDITQNGDGTISFNYVAVNTSTGGGGGTVTPVDADFYESFDQCEGTGGNDGSWSGSIANGKFNADHTGWEANNSYGANQCAKFGNSSNAGSATTPTITLNGTATLSFKAGAWKGKKDGTGLNVSVTGGTIDKSSFEMVQGEFNDYSATVTGYGEVTITFAAEKGRFFLDEVILKSSSTTGIEKVESRETRDNTFYTLSGQRVEKPTKGLYIINGKKVVIK